MNMVRSFLKWIREVDEEWEECEKWLDETMREHREDFKRDAKQRRAESIDKVKKIIFRER